MRDNSHKLVVTRAILHTALYPVLAFIVRRGYGLEVFTSSILKFLFCANVLFMVGAWYESHLIAKGTPYTTRDIVKCLLFTMLFMVFLEFWNIIIAP